MINSKFVKHLTLRIMLIYACVFLLIVSSIVLIVNVTSGSRTAMFIKPIVQSKINLLDDIYSLKGKEKLLHILKRNKRTFDFILKENDRILYSSISMPNKIIREPNDDLGIISYEDVNRDDYIGIQRQLDDSFNLIVLFNIELLDEQRGLTHLIANIGIVISILGLLTIGWLTYGLRKRLRFLNNSLSQIVRFSSLESRIDISNTGDEIDELSKNINKVLVHIEDLVNKKQLMINNIAHDLRTPLTRVSNTINRHFGNQESKERDEIISQISNLLEIFDSILRISKIDGTQPKKLEECNLNEVLEDIFELYKPLAEDKGLSMDLNLNYNLSFVCDKSLVCQAVVNCLDNAIKYTQSGHVKLEGYKNEEHLYIKVIDTGIGIPKDKRKEILQPFYRLDESRSSVGFGLGLSLVNSIVQAHGGDIKIFHNENKGTIVQLIFPLNRDV